MLVDILIPSKNPDKNLLKTIESITSIKEIKSIIIIDDSKNLNNKIYKIIRKKYEKTFVINNRYLSGISGALNTGIEYSNSKFISRIDSGDICLDKKRFKKILNLFAKKINIDLVCTGLINNKNKKIKPKCIYKGKILTPFSRVPHPTWIMKKSSIIQKYKYECNRFEDYAFLIDNKMKILVLNQYDLLYDTSDNLSRVTELKTAYLKSIFFLKNSQKDFKSFVIAVLYLLLRSIRLILSSQKIIF